jgi:hypothetical protein
VRLAREEMPCFCLVRLTGATQIPRFKGKNLIGYVEYWNAGRGESRCHNRSETVSAYHRRFYPHQEPIVVNLEPADASQQSANDAIHGR